MERSFIFAPSQYYHLYNRGVDKQEVFFTDDEYKLFQKLLFFRNDPTGSVKSSRLANRKLNDAKRDTTLIDICAYALLPNHFHLLVRETVEGGISRFMSKLQTSYAKYMNTKYERSGPLMCRPYRAKHVTDDAYMRWLISYIHLNPLELAEPNWKEKGIGDPAAASVFIRTYPYSSYQDYFVADRDETRIINKEALPFFISDLEDVSVMHQVYNSDSDN